MEPAGLLPAPHASKWSGRATSAPWVEVRTDCQGVSPHGSGLPGAAVAELPRAVVQSHGESMRRGGSGGVLGTDSSLVFSANCWPGCNLIGCFFILSMHCGVCVRQI